MASLGPRSLLSQAVTAAKLGAARRFLKVDAKAVRYSKHGHPSNVLKLETVSLDTASMKPSQVLIRMVSAPITPSDLSQIAGFGSKGVSSPRVGGNEGLGVVEEVGSAVKGLTKGQYVVASSSGQGTWSTHVIGDAESWTAVPSNLASQIGTPSFPKEIAAVSVAAPLLAKSLINDFVKLKAGDVIVQNNAYSSVGQAVVQYAAKHGIKTVNIVNFTPDWDKTVPHLQGLGATIVVNDKYASTPAFAKLVKDLPAGRLGLNSVGGKAASAVAKALGEGAQMVTYGSVGAQAVQAPLDWFVSKGLTLSGANIDGKLRALPKAQRDAEVQAALADVAGDEKAGVKLFVAREPFLDFPQALSRAMNPYDRKIVLNF